MSDFKSKLDSLIEKFNKIQNEPIVTELTVTGETRITTSSQLQKLIDLTSISLELQLLLAQKHQEGEQLAQSLLQNISSPTTPYSTATAWPTASELRQLFYSQQPNDNNNNNNDKGNTTPP